MFMLTLHPILEHLAFRLHLILMLLCAWKYLSASFSPIATSLTCYIFNSRVDLVTHYLAKAKEIVHNRSYEAAGAKEDAFRNTLSLLILLQNPPGDLAAHVKEDIVDGFCEIFTFNRY